MNFQNLISRRRASVKKIHFFIFRIISDNFLRIFYIFFTIREHYWLHLGPFLATLPKSSSDLFQLSYGRLLKSFLEQFTVVIVILSGLINVYLVNYFSASLTVRNKSMAQHLYTVFNGRDFICFLNREPSHRLFNSVGDRITNTNLLLKIDTFIDRLNNQYVGFKCLNMFEFTTFYFYEYIFGVFSAYLLVSSINT